MSWKALPSLIAIIPVKHLDMSDSRMKSLVQHFSYPSLRPILMTLSTGWFFPHLETPSTLSKYADFNFSTTGPRLSRYT
jgi:hypothetical protein